METDCNLLFGLLAMQADLIGAEQFVEVCTLWSGRKQTSLGDLLVERGWLSISGRDDVNRLLEQKLRKHGGDTRASLAAMTTDHISGQQADQTGGTVITPVGQLTTAPDEPTVATTDHQPSQGRRYTRIRVHAGGGIGRVWLARDNSLGRDVALKELRPERASHPALWGRFLRKARVTGQLEHPGIVPIYEVGRNPDDTPFYAMRFVRGRTLAEAVADLHARRSRGERLDLELRELLGAFVSVCNTVAYAHSQGVLHRDLKPQNVVLGDFGEAIVLDWGLARLTSEKEEAGPTVEPAEMAGQETVQGQVLGTPAYMSPEQAEGRLDLLDARSDVYGLGAILYEMLTGQPPFTGGDVQALLRRVIHQAPTPPRSLRPGVPRSLEAVCLKALAKSPTDRYASAKDLADDVRRWLADEPVRAYREPLPARAARWARLHRTAVTGALAALIAALVGLGVVLGVQSRANAALREANRRERERFGLAQKAIEAFHTGVSEDALLKTPQLESLRNRLLRSAADFYQQLEGLLRDQPDVDSRRALGKAYDKLATLTERIGDRQRALAVYQRGLAVWEALAADDPASPEYRAELAESLEAIGRLHRDAGRQRDGTEFYRRALAVREMLAESHPAEPRYRQALANSQGNVARCMHKEGDRVGALACYRQGLELLRELVAAHPEESDYLSDLCSLLHNMAGVLDDLGRHREALDAYEQNLALRRDLVKKDPHSSFYQFCLGFALNSLGQYLDQVGESQRAIEVLREGLTIRERLAGNNPAVTNYQDSLADSLQILAQALDSRDPTEALALNQRALTVRQKLSDAQPASVAVLADVAVSQGAVADRLRKLGRFAESLEFARRSLAVRQRLAAAQPGMAGPQEQVAAAHRDIAHALRELDKPAEARESYRIALEAYEKLAGAHPDAPEYRSKSAICHQTLGELLAKAGKPDEALGAYHRSLALLQALVDQHSDSMMYQSQLAGVYNAIALLHEERPAEAEKWLHKEAAIRRHLAGRYPTDLNLKENLATTEHNHAVMLESAGKPGPALEARRRSLAIWQRLHEEAPTVASYLVGLVDAYSALALRLASDGKSAEALKLHQSALHGRRQILAARPADVEQQTRLLEQITKIGYLSYLVDKPAEAQRAFREAAARGEELASRHPGEVKWRLMLTESRLWLSQTLCDIGQAEHALESARQAVAAAESLPRAHPSAVEQQRYLADALQDLALRQADLGRAAEASEIQRRALALRQLVADAEPDDRDRQAALSSAWLHLAYLETERGNVEVSLAMLDKVIAAVEKRKPKAVSSEDAGLRILVDSWRGRANRLAGRAALAAADLRRAAAAWEAMPHLPVDRRFERARCLAQLALLGGNRDSGVTAAEAAEAARKAVAVLAEMTAAGWRPARRLGGKDFDSLRGRADFRKILDDKGK